MMATKSSLIVACFLATLVVAGGVMEASAEPTLSTCAKEIADKLLTIELPAEILTIQYGDDWDFELCNDLMRKYLAVYKTFSSCVQFRDQLEHELKTIIEGKRDMKAVNLNCGSFLHAAYLTAFGVKKEDQTTN